MPQLSPELLNQIVMLLAPHLENEPARHALIDQALGLGRDASIIKNNIDFSGSTKVFTTYLVRELVEFGTLDNGELALVAVLTVARLQTGTNRQANYDDIITQIKASPPNIMSSYSNPNGVHWTNYIGLLIALIGTIAAVIAVLPNRSADPALVATQNPLPSTTAVQVIAPTSIPMIVTATSPPALAKVINNLPCSGMIRVSTSGILNQVRASAMQTAPLITPVNQGETITIISVRENDGYTWYQIQYDERQRSGWIKSEFVMPSTSC